MRGGNLAHLILQDVGMRAVQHAGNASVEARGVLAESRAAPSRFDTDHRHRLVVQKLVEQSDGVAPPPDAG